MLTMTRSLLTWFAAAFVAVAVLVSSPRPVAAYPPAGTDAFDSAATVTIDLSFSGGPVMTETATGPTRITRGDPFDPGDHRMQIDTEIVSMQLSGRTAFGPITIRESPTKQSTGYVRQQTAEADFPADSFFDVYVEMDTPLGQLHNNDPVAMHAVIGAIPPFGALYEPPIPIPVDLLNAAGQKVGVIMHAQHFVGEKASFSAAPGGPSGLLPADIFDVPTTLRIPAASLGLVADDDVDGLSYGLEYIAYDTDVRFSVAPGAAGVPGSAVATEAAKVPPEAQGDEFAVFPPFPAGGSNVQVRDEDGSSGPAFPLLVSDDVDALADQPASFVDTDGDTVPDAGKPVYFSLAPGSPTLAAIGATPADILMNTVPPGPPTVFLSRAALGLIPGDDLDDFCLDATTSFVLFSLAPGSPTLGVVGASPSDLFFAYNPPMAAPPPVLIRAAWLGLLPTDDLNALKCLPPMPTDTDGDGILDGKDNCRTVYNPDQTNTPIGPIGNGAGIHGDDLTNPFEDTVGDACDDDLDNDGIPNASDPDPAPGEPIDITYDDNGDGTWKGAGDDGPSWDSNMNGKRDGVEGTCTTSSADTDSDGLLDRWEECKWGTDPAKADSDRDGKGDCVEAADVDGNSVVNFTGDVIDYAKAALLPCPGPTCFGQDGDFDIDGNNALNFTGDVIQEAKFGLIPGLCK